MLLHNCHEQCKTSALLPKFWLLSDCANISGGLDEGGSLVAGFRYLVPAVSSDKHKLCHDILYGKPLHLREKTKSTLHLVSGSAGNTPDARHGQQTASLRI